MTVIAKREGWLATARWAAILCAALAPVSTAAASVASALFVLALAGSGTLAQVAARSWRLPAGKAIAAFGLVVLASASWSPESFSDAMVDAWAWRKLAFLYLALALFDEEAWRERGVRAYALAMVVFAAFSYLSLAGVVPDRTHWGPGVVLTNYTTQGIAFAIGTLFAARLARESRGRIRLAWAAAAVALAVNLLFFSQGRSGHLAFAGMALTGGLLWAGRRGMLAAALASVALLAAAFVLSPTFHARVTDGIDEIRDAARATQVTPMGIRVAFAANTMELIAERPLLGHGLGSYRPLYARHAAANHEGLRAQPSGDPHNQYLYVAMEQGLAGLAVFLAMIVVLFRGFPATPHGRLAACVLAAWCLTALFNSHFRNFTEGHLYAFLVGMLGAAGGRGAGAPGNARYS